jgi:glycosyltransferase involved in cell wall biosynthesis
VTASRALRRPCRHLIVAVPARDEQTTIVDCLASIDRAATRVSAPVTIALAADSCSDETVAIARAVTLGRAELTVIEGTWGRAGAARAAAVTHALERIGSVHRCWIANTDADCRVPVDWLAVQLQHARRAAAVAGVVTLDPATTPRHLLTAFHRTYRIEGDRHRHVHAANLGIWADDYTAAGGWCTRTTVGEDHALWDAVRAGGRPVTQTAASRVITSARVRSRVDGGFATDLSRLTTEPPAA